MPMVGVSRCPLCQAVVNVKWTDCPACHGGIKESHPGPPDVGDRIVYQVDGDPQEGPFEVVMVSPDRYKGGWWMVVVKPGPNGSAEQKADTPATVFIHQRLVTQVIPKESQTSTE